MINPLAYFDGRETFTSLGDVSSTWNIIWW